MDIAERDPGLEDVFLQLLGTSKQGAVQFFLGPASAVAVKVPVDIAHVTRRFGDFAAVDDVSLRIEKGEIFGLLGPNGAGKTTLIKMMCGLTGPSAGSIRVAGFDIRSEQEHVWSQIGYMSQRFSLYRDLTVNQNLRLYADLYGVETSFDDLAASLGLEPFQSRLAGDLPVGLRQRLSLLCAVLHRPPVLFLDEPTSGVDPPARRIFWDLIYSLSRESAVTVLVSTHYMDEANHCDRLGLMDQGRLVACGSPSALKQASEQRSGKLLAITAANFRKTLDVLLPYFPDAVLYGDGIHLRSLDLEADERRAESLLRRAGITEMKITRPALSMDEAFMDFIRTAEMVHA